MKDGNRTEASEGWALHSLHNTTLSTCIFSPADSAHSRPAEEINILIYQPDSKNRLHSHEAADK